MLAEAYRDGHGERTAVVLQGFVFVVAAGLFNLIWGWARHGGRLLSPTLDPGGATAIARRFQLALAWLGAGTALGALSPILGGLVIAAFNIYYWLPIAGELGRRPSGEAA